MPRALQPAQNESPGRRGGPASDTGAQSAALAYRPRGAQCRDSPIRRAGLIERMNAKRAEGAKAGAWRRDRESGFRGRGRTGTRVLGTEHRFAQETDHHGCRHRSSPPHGETPTGSAQARQTPAPIRSRDKDAQCKELDRGSCYHLVIFHPRIVRNFRGEAHLAAEHVIVIVEDET